MRRTETITPDIVRSVKDLLERNSQRNIASKLNVSQYTVWCIANGRYDTREPLQINRIIKQSNFIHQ